MIHCSVCHEENREENLFCTRCMSPVNVQALVDYTLEDKQFILTLLLDTIAQVRTKALTQRTFPSASSLGTISPFFDEYLNIYWLRPETAIWRTIEAEILIKYHCLEEPLLDLGCGDGINISIVRGNKFSPQFDSFQSVKLEQKDIYDYFDQAYSPQLTFHHPQPIASGIDIKETQVLKARALGTYFEVLQGDIHHLPWQEPRFKTVYSNVIKDFEPLQPILLEVHRVLVERGVLVLTTPNENFKKNLYFINKARYYQEQGQQELAKKFLEYDRGRSVYSATQKTAAQWTQELQQAGFVVENIISYISPELIQLFDIGTRAFSIDAIKAYTEARRVQNGIFLKQLAVPVIKHVFSTYLDVLERSDGCFMIIKARKVSR